ncbi:hypothetical protein [Thermaurantiacus sp.]
MDEGDLVRPLLALWGPQPEEDGRERMDEEERARLRGTAGEGRGDQEEGRAQADADEGFGHTRRAEAVEEAGRETRGGEGVAEGAELPAEQAGTGKVPTQREIFKGPDETGDRDQDGRQAGGGLEGKGRHRQSRRWTGDRARILGSMSA